MIGRSIYSWSRLATRTLAAAAGHLGNPLKLVFVVTKRCHSRCVYCDIWKVKDTPGALDRELSLDEIRRIAAANPALQWIDFTGGEPTDRPDFVEVVEAFAQNCPDLLLVHFPTNGLATARIADAVQRLSVSVRARLVVTVSIDGPPELNDRLRGVRRDFDHAVATFAAVRKLIGAENTFIGMTLHAHRATAGQSATALVTQTFDAINHALTAVQHEPIGWETLHLNIPHVSQHYYGNSAAADPTSADGFGGAAHRTETAAALDFAAAQSKHAGSVAMRSLERVYRHEAQRYLAEGRAGIRCSALALTAYLAETGEVYPCTIWDKPLGNVRDHDYALRPILDTARANGVRRAVSAGQCPQCWTPCEAYPAIAASPLRALRSLVSPGK